MSVLFFTEGGGSYGLGHISRTKSIAEALEEEWTKSVFFCDAPETLSLGNSRVIRFNWYRDHARLESELSSLDTPVDAIVVDSYQAEAKTLRYLAGFRTPILFLDDYYRLDYPKGLIVNPAYIKYPDMFGWRVFTGPDFFPLRSAFWDAERLSLPERKHTLITLGGASGHNILLPAVQAAREAVEGEIIVLTAGEELPSLPNVSYTDSLDMHDMRRALQQARLVVCGGGVTLAEAARVGTPAAVISLAQNQTGNIKLFCLGGSAIFAGEAGSPDLGANLSKKIAFLNDDYHWERLSKKGVSLVDGQGARRIARLLLLEIDGVFYRNELRKDHEINGVYLTHFTNCSNEELAMILNARNSEAVLNTVYNQQKVTSAAHAEFVKSLESSVNSGYWLISEGETYLGVFSLTDVDRFNSECEVGYYKFPSSERNGVGKLLLELAAFTAFNKLNLSSVIADTFAENTASIKSLERSGFLFEEEKQKTVCNERQTVRRYRLWR
ncbi:MAG: UDP-4-amino-4,6-dideoxy-N-acetyl-beta-L-altrosamine N-acetyltransferase [Deferribacteraceae bacterium]|jgi:UDP-4-amino-4,6-dideoxy-N-acetyl-beta-L-altrosamine N-acetyltransferase|nr:UDP-4-amino-4,6-dideoxy-N-acetyl-beta-L-altrosamine N-acetyltransferase [Deferribacteraceae bacterium]